MEANLYTGKARLRPRDIRAALRGKNIDPALIQTLETLAEQDGTLRAQIEKLAELVNGFADQVIQLQTVLGVVTNNMPLKQRENILKEVKDVALSRIKIMGEDEASEN